MVRLRRNLQYGIWGSQALSARSRAEIVDTIKQYNYTMSQHLKSWKIKNSKIFSKIRKQPYHPTGDIKQKNEVVETVNSK